MPPAADDEVTENNNRCGRIGDGAGAAELKSRPERWQAKLKPKPSQAEAEAEARPSKSTSRSRQTGPAFVANHGNYGNEKVAQAVRQRQRRHPSPTGRYPVKLWATSNSIDSRDP